MLRHRGERVVGRRWEVAKDRLGEEALPAGAGTLDRDRDDPVQQAGNDDEFFEMLAGGRRYQREALEAALLYLCGARYGSTADLARETYAASPDLPRRYATSEQLVEALPFPDMLACSLDLATATGKSYVLYGIARVMLNEGLVDRVLVLCPSLTIEDGLREKFESLTADSALTDLLPDRHGTRIPDIVDAGTTIRMGQICTENIHATYERTGSSIADSFVGQGATTLVLSDEAHHIHSPQGKDMKQWKEFILRPEYGFRYHVGVSGTCYVGNDYFTDVVYRYSIGKAMDERTVKEVYYLEEDDSRTDDERFQKLLSQHEKTRQTYGLKPLTIAVTRDIKTAEELAEDLIAFLAERLIGGYDVARERVLVVTSAQRHAPNVRKLKTVDEVGDPTEWIVSVAMLSEGWDVKNVFQIYPHEKRAFNSKLLIAQVLGRGLRVPKLGSGVHPVVRVFNHQNWGPEVEGLVAEVIDQETLIAQRPVHRREVPHFELHDLVYEQVPTGIEASELQRPKDVGKLTLHPQKDAPEETRFRSVLDPSRVDVLTTRVIEKLYPVETVIEEVRQRLLGHDKRTGGDLAKRYLKKRIGKLIADAFERLGLPGDRVSQENRQIILSTFGSLRQATARPGAILASEPVGLRVVLTETMAPVRARVSGITSSLALHYDADSERLGTADDVAAMKKAREIDRSVPTYLLEIGNTFLFKSPVNVVLASYAPERQFVARLFRQENAAVIRSWIKAPDVGFYAIEFSYQGRSGGTKRSSFNPDYFLLLENGDVVVVETKADGDESPENVGKFKYASDHFAKVNKMLEAAGESRRYRVHFVSPSDYDRFFEALRSAELDRFVSSLQAALKANTNGAR
jgi:type III restriction enzyme